MQSLQGILCHYSRPYCRTGAWFEVLDLLVEYYFSKKDLTEGGYHTAVRIYSEALRNLCRDAENAQASVTSNSPQDFSFMAKRIRYLRLFLHRLHDLQGLQYPSPNYLGEIGSVNAYYRALRVLWEFPEIGPQIVRLESKMWSAAGSEDFANASRAQQTINSLLSGRQNKQKLPEAYAPVTETYSTNHKP